MTVLEFHVERDDQKETTKIRWVGDADGVVYFALHSLSPIPHLPWELKLVEVCQMRQALGFKAVDPSKIDGEWHLFNERVLEDYEQPAAGELK